jgi:hypothetical protein
MEAAWGQPVAVSAPGSRSFLGTTCRLCHGVLGVAEVLRFQPLELALEPLAQVGSPPLDRRLRRGSMTKVDALEGGEDPKQLLAQIA